MDLSIDINKEIIIVGKLVLSLFLGAIIGLDREKHRKDAGIRTYAAVCLGASIFTSIAEHFTDDAGASRVIANIIVGIGFIGSGVIFRNGEQNISHGLTTSASVWGTAAVGVAIGMNMFVVGIFSTAALYFLLSLHHQNWYMKWKQRIVDKAHRGEDMAE